MVCYNYTDSVRRTRYQTQKRSTLKFKVTFTNFLATNSMLSLPLPAFGTLAAANTYTRSWLHASCATALTPFSAEQWGALSHCCCISFAFFVDFFYIVLPTLSGSKNFVVGALFDQRCITIKVLYLLFNVIRFLLLHA